MRNSCRGANSSSLDFEVAPLREMANSGDVVIICVRSVEKEDRVCSATGFHLKGRFVCSCPGRKYTPKCISQVEETMFHTIAALNLHVCNNRACTLYNDGFCQTGGKRGSDEDVHKWQTVWRLRVAWALLPNSRALGWACRPKRRLSAISCTRVRRGTLGPTSRGWGPCVVVGACEKSLAPVSVRAENFPCCVLDHGLPVRVPQGRARAASAAGNLWRQEQCGL